MGEGEESSMKKSERDVQQFNDAIKKHGTEITYFPLLGRTVGAKKTRVKGDAFLASCGLPVVFIEGVSGYVAVRNIQVGGE